MSQKFGVPYHVVYDTTSGNLLKVNDDGSLNVTGGSSSNPSVGITGAVAPLSATEVGFIDGSGNLIAPSSTNPLPVSGTFTESVQGVTGNASSAAVLSNFPLTIAPGYRTASVQVTALAANSTLVAEQSNDGVSWTGILSTIDTAAETSTPMSSVGLYTFPVSALKFRVRQSIYGGAGTSTAVVELREAVPLQSSVYQGGSWSVTVLNFPAVQAISATALPLPAGASTEATLSAFKTASHTDLAQINTTLGSPFQVGGNIGNTVFASTQSGVWTVAVSNFPGTQPISGTVTANQGGAPWSVSQSGTWTVGLTAGQSIELLDAGGTNKASISVAGALKVDGSAATQPVSGSVSVSNFPATQPVSIAATVAVSGPLTDTQLRATAVPVSGTFFQATQPVSIASMPSTPVTGPLTDTQLRATAVPVSGTVTASQGSPPWTTNEVATAPTDRSSTITSGGVAQQAMASNSVRREAWVFNPDPSEALWINITGGTAAANAAGSIGLPAGTGWSGMVTSAISIIAVTTGHKFTAGER